jgi:tRNA threonylcarbamoyl adenosine modification protein YeaZ
MLAIETSSLRGSVALGRGGRLLGLRRLSGDRRHTAELMPTIRDLLDENGLTAPDVGVFCYSRGPGSFTGLRIAATVGRMLQSAVDCRVVAADTVEVVARNVLSHPDRPERIVAILDVGRGRAYAALFERVGDAELCARIHPGACDPSRWLAELDEPFWITGEGLNRHRAACEASGGRIVDDSYWPPSAEHVLAVGRRMAVEGRFCRPEEILPLYLRPPECEVVYEQRRAEARRRRGE